MADPMACADLPHTKDEDCAPGVDGLCARCHVDHSGPPCPQCQKRAFHRADCPLLVAEEWHVVKGRPGLTRRGRLLVASRVRPRLPHAESPLHCRHGASLLDYCEGCLLHAMVRELVLATTAYASALELEHQSTVNLEALYNELRDVVGVTTAELAARP